MNRLLGLWFFLHCCLGVQTATAEQLTIVHNKDYKPYAYVDSEGKSKGLLIDLWSLWAKKVEVDVEFVPAFFKDCLRMVREGEADIVIGMFYSKGRSEFFDFSNSLVDVETELYAATNLEISSSKDLGKHPVGVIKSDYVVSYLKTNRPYLELKEFDGSKEIIEAALKGELKAFALDFPNAMFLLSRSDAITKFRKIETLYSEKLRGGVKKGNSRLQALINQGLSRIGIIERRELFNNWGVFAPRPLMLRYRYWVAGGLALLLLLGLISTLYIFRLRKKMRFAALNQESKVSDWLELIAQGESDSVEFKSSLRWNLVTQKGDKNIELAIVKAISAFLNSDGGRLFIGVNDQGELLGIEQDCKLFKKKPNKDGFALALANAVGQCLGSEFHQYLSVEIREFGGKDICLVKISPSDKPVFFKAKGIEEFYIRGSASSVPLSISESHSYINTRWIRAGK